MRARPPSPATWPRVNGRRVGVARAGRALPARAAQSARGGAFPPARPLPNERGGGGFGAALGGGSRRCLAGGRALGRVLAMLCRALLRRAAATSAVPPREYRRDPAP